MSKSSPPILTLEDKINVSTFFEKDSPPALIVEGKTDTKIYSRMLVISELKWDEIDLVFAEGKRNIIKAIEDGLPFEYVALMDLDLDAYNNCCRTEEEIVYTHFYSVENYLTTEEVLDLLINDIRTIHQPIINANQIIERLEEELFPLAIACILKADHDWSIKLEQCDVMRWHSDERKIDANSLKEYLLQQLNSVGISMSSNELDELYIQKTADIKAAGMVLDKIVPGKQKLTSVFFEFQRNFPHHMSRRQINIFTLDLYKYITESKYIKELVQEIDEKLSVKMATRNAC